MISTDEEGTQIIGKLIENEVDGVYFYKGLDIGTYYLKETRSPKYYITDPNVYKFEVTTEYAHPVVDNVSWDVIEGVTGSFINVNPIVRTTLTDKDTKEHVTSVRKDVTLIDTV